jgi:hypothetical protein
MSTLTIEQAKPTAQPSSSPATAKPEVMAKPDGRLLDLANRIKTEHAAIGAAFKRALVPAIAAGEALNEAKGLVGHGQWLSWLEGNCQIAERTAQLYMKLASGKSVLESKSANLADLTLSEAVKLIDPPSTPASTPNGNGAGNDDKGEAPRAQSSGNTSSPSSSGRKSKLTPSDKYSNAEARLIEKLQDLTPETADTCVSATIKVLKATLAAMKAA